MRGVGLPGLSRGRTVVFDFLHTAGVFLGVHAILVGASLEQTVADSGLCGVRRCTSRGDKRGNRGSERGEK